jgi:ligand-binding sensor domain-containing protein
MIATVAAAWWVATQDQVFTSTSEIRSIEAGVDGSVGISTSGGMLVRSKDGVWRKYTTLNGLPNNAVSFSPSDPSGHFVNGRYLYRKEGESWSVAREILLHHGPGWIRNVRKVSWKGRTLFLNPGELATSDKETRISLPPDSKGTHFSAATSNGASIWAAVYGDGIWTYDGKAWKKIQAPQGIELTDVTFLFRERGVLWVGTRRGGAYEVTSEGWNPVPRSSEPAAHQVHSLAWNGGSIYVGTANDGIVSYDGKAWAHATTPAISSNAPGSLYAWGSELVVGQGSAGLDRFAAGKWTSRAFAEGMPKRGAFFFASEANRLFVSQVGGWSEFDGTSWTAHLNEPDLQNMAPTALLPFQGKVWIGTQGKGLAEADTATRKLRWSAENAGFKDDWITCLASARGRVFAGTFTGGCMVYDGVAWSSLDPLTGMHVTDLEEDGKGGLYISTLDNLWHWTGVEGVQSLGKRHPGVRGGIAALAMSPKGLWVGTNEGIYLLPVP